MNKRSRLIAWWTLFALIASAAVALVVVLARPGAKTSPEVGSQTYQDMVSAFFSGVAALDADANQIAKPSLTRATELVPFEPAAWANLGLLAIREGDLDASEAALTRAQSLAPDRGEIERFLALLESRRGHFAESIAHMKRAIQLDPNDLKTRFELARELERQGGPVGTADALRSIEEILKVQPLNLAALLERARLAAKADNAEALRDTAARLEPLAASWPPQVQSRYQVLAQAIDDGNPRLAATQTLVLRNVLVTVPAFRQSLDALQIPIGTIGEPLEYFLKLKNPTPTPSPADTGLSYALNPLNSATKPARWASIVSIAQGKDGTPLLWATDGRIIRRVDQSGADLPFPGGPDPPPTTPESIAVADWNSDYALDLVCAGAGGIRIFQQKPDGTFADVSSSTGLGPEALKTDAFGVWTADLDLDGDLDFVVGARTGPSFVLQNQGDGTFSITRPFPNSNDLCGFVWADFNQDGTPDAGLLDAQGKLNVFTNERSGRFLARSVPKDLGRITALTIADMNNDGSIDILALRNDGAVLLVSDRDDGETWNTGEIARWPGKLGDNARLFSADLDNNGGLDLLVTDGSNSRAWLTDESGNLLPLAAPISLRVLEIADQTGDGRLDLAGLSEDGRAVRAVARGTKSYHWQVVRPRAAKVVGDGRINSFGLGGEVEVRAGLLVQKQVITDTTVHFGLGEHAKTDVSRVVWPNGTMQAEFNTRANVVIAAEQRLKGSCPFVYAFDGQRMSFVTDFLWRSPLGLRINAQDTAGVAQTEDWIKIRGDQLKPRNGMYEICLTAELWETHYFDHVSLMVIDHPIGTDVFVDERFARQPPPLTVQATGPLLPLAAARDDEGRDVTPLVRARDGRYLDHFGRGFYQGVTRDHWVELELGNDTPSDRPLVLVAHGWIHPTDSSLNVALGQGRHDPPRGLSLEVPTPDGQWVVARNDLGFPAGKNKTILINLDGMFKPGAPRCLRLRTNLEIYWDAFNVAAAATETPLNTRRIPPASAELRHRGYSLMTQADASSPELPIYETLTGTRQRWLDLVGLYTRYGDVRELLELVDDRYAIVNAGDEIAFRFPAPEGPPKNWVRDYVLIGDGWNKDGDFNTAYSRMVLPLPSHDRPSYDAPPGPLEADPIYQKNPQDWVNYHTRPISPRTFLNGLRPQGVARPD